MKDWVVDALRSLGGTGSILEVSRFVWLAHEQEIRAEGDLLFEWQYELRWAADALRREGKLLPTSDLQRGTWGLA